MKKEFVPYELAVKLKELGFDEDCLGYYYDKNFVTILHRLDKEVVKAPTFSQCFRWFRDKYRMFHEVFIDTEPTVDEPDKLEFTYLILHMVGTQEMFTSKNKRFDTYEEAELACLDKLLEIVESNLN